ncbi:chemotaxis protein CheD [Allopseudospirillum japonicum]|uniref:Probable chemoreceptor glutamine deamidase CheD n=1 Tax=Allopseudospirillum japonicum TaxID=64971 RepID=A0A1H6S6W1_9GAMM|nr:chemoreceptor glutamine deamidase CheD [Allopseudospirillum japonicum]SEI60547.1 chemotaxis protein CheD [Allopseudospirillum japonicum]
MSDFIHSAPTHKRFREPHLQMDMIKIHPGEYCATAETELALGTILGSCVSACIWDPKLGVGGMNHFMLPECGQVNSPLSTAARYGTHAMEMLVNSLLKLGAHKENLQVKVFGGGRVLDSLKQADIGTRNANFVLHYIKMEGLKLVAKDLLDIYPRKVFFIPQTGQAFVRKLKNYRG